MFMVQVRQNDGSWWDWRGGTLRGPITTFSTQREARFTYTNYQNGRCGGYGIRWRVVPAQ